MKTIPQQAFLYCVLIGLVFGSIACSNSEPSREEISTSQALVQSYADAYSAQDLAKMEQVMHDDIEWINIEGSTQSTMTQGKKALVAELSGYFSGTQNTASALSNWSTNGNFVSVTETVSFKRKDGSQASQASLSVYELEDGLIRRVWYFPAQ